MGGEFAILYVYFYTKIRSGRVGSHVFAPNGRAVPSGREVARRTKNPGLQYGFRIPLATPEET